MGSGRKNWMFSVYFLSARNRNLYTRESRVSPCLSSVDTATYVFTYNPWDYPQTTLIWDSFYIKPLRLPSPHKSLPATVSTTEHELINNSNNVRHHLAQPPASRSDIHLVELIYPVGGEDEQRWHRINIHDPR